jgi:hypothetical protein
MVMIDFEKLIDEIVIDTKPLDDDFDEKRFHPSSAGFCERQIFLRKIGMVAFNRYVTGSMMSGTIIHNWLQGHLKGKGEIELEIKTTLQDPKYNPHNLYFKGHSDFVPHGIPYDFKSTANIKFNSKKVADHHRDQLLVYMAGLGAKEGAIVYIDKRDLSPKQFIIQSDQQRIKDIFAKITRVYEAELAWKKSKDKKIPFEKCGCYFCTEEKLKEYSEICECGGTANLVYYDHTEGILKCNACGDEFAAAQI